jgi:hypothetical protein
MAAKKTAGDKAADKAAAKAAADEQAAAAKESAKEVEQTKTPNVYRADMGESLPPQAPPPTATDKHP